MTTSRPNDCKLTFDCWSYHMIVVGHHNYCLNLGHCYSVYYNPHGCCYDTNCDGLSQSCSNQNDHYGCHVGCDYCRDGSDCFGDHFSCHLDRHHSDLRHDSTGHYGSIDHVNRTNGRIDRRNWTIVFGRHYVQNHHENHHGCNDQNHVYSGHVVFFSFIFFPQSQVSNKVGCVPMVVSILPIRNSDHRKARSTLCKK